MAQDEDHQITAKIEKSLTSTPYACSSLTRLSGGTANFIYRGILQRPLEDGTKTVIIKHAEEFLASSKDFKLTAERCVCCPYIIKKKGKCANGTHR